MCLKNALRKMCVTICGRFCSDESVVAGYDNRIRTKYTAKWGVQIAGMIFQTRSNVRHSCSHQSISVQYQHQSYRQVNFFLRHQINIYCTKRLPFLQEIFILHGDSLPNFFFKKQKFLFSLFAVFLSVFHSFPAFSRQSAS